MVYPPKDGRCSKGVESKTGSKLCLPYAVVSLFKKPSLRGKPYYTFSRTYWMSFAASYPPGDWQSIVNRCFFFMNKPYTPGETQHVGKCCLSYPCFGCSEQASLCGNPTIPFPAPDTGYPCHGLLSTRRLLMHAWRRIWSALRLAAASTSWAQR